MDVGQCLKKLADAAQRGDYMEMVSLIAKAEPGQERELASLISTQFSPSVIEDIRETEDVADQLFMLGCELWHSGDQELLSIEVFRAAVRLGSDDALMVVGDVLAWMGAYEEAIPFLAAARSKGIGDQDWIAGLLGESRYALGDRDLEVELLIRQGASKHDEFGVTYAEILQSRGEYHAAKEILSRLVLADVNDAAIRLGNLLSDDLGDDAGAIEAYLKGVRAGDGHSAHNLAVLYRDQGRFSEARFYLEIAHRLGDSSDLVIEDE